MTQHVIFVVGEGGGAAKAAGGRHFIRDGGGGGGGGRPHKAMLDPGLVFIPYAFGEIFA